jgi:Asp-tRNA(Asn)/Glu-tRNA(Gln) amidotransferase A subunit family amidase
MGLSTMHAITRSVRDSAMLLDIAQGPEHGSRVVPQQPGTSYMAQMGKPPQRLRIALWETNPFGRPVHADCKAALARAAKLCESLGHHVEPAAPDIPVMEAFGALGTLVGTGVLAVIRDREKALGRAVAEQDLERVTWHNIQEAMQCDAEQLYRARAVFDQLGRLFDEFLTRYDVILSPVTAGPPPKLGELSLDQPYERFMQAATDASPFTAPYNMNGLPAMSVPLHWNAQNLPIGSQFAGRFGDELTLLKLAAQLEAAAPWADRRPTEV